MRHIMMISAATLACVWVSAASAKPKLTVLQDLTTQTGGGPEYPPIVGKDGLLYGTTYTSNNGGGIYSIGKDGKNFAVLYEFPGGQAGNGPFGQLVQGPDGLFYGTTLFGGTSGQGTVFQFDASARSVTILHAFDVGDGAYPYAGLVQDKAGNFYGTTSTGGADGFGTIYKIASGSNAFSKIADFSSNSGGQPFSPLLVGKDGMLYGTTTNFGPSGKGTIFRLSTQGGKIEVLHGFSGPDGAAPFSALIGGKNGVFYGTTDFGGKTNDGVVFSFTLKGRKLAVLHSFSGPDGAYPQGTLALDGDGRLLGTTGAFGAHGGGTIYRYDPASSSFETIYELSPGVAAEPNAGLTSAGGTKFYGGALNGGTSQFEQGAIFKFSE